jgi:transcriptional regulator with XRE-family HTH domain
MPRHPQRPEPYADLTTFGGRLRDARTRHLLAQADVARRTGIGIATLSRLEGNKQVPRLGTAETLAGALGVELPWLFLGRGGRNRRQPRRMQKAREMPGK